MNLPSAPDLVADAKRGYPDLQEHLEELKRRGLLLTITRPVDKDSELHPLVRWQFVGGMDEAERKAFLFTNITDGRGRKYDIPVVVGAIAANRAIYSAGMGAPLSEIQGEWNHAMAPPIARCELECAACHEIVHEGEALRGEGKGLDRLPIPISTPGFDSAPTLTATNVITRDPETGVQNMGTYRAALKSSDRLVVRMATRAGGAGGYLHYVKYQKLGKKTMPCAIVQRRNPIIPSYISQVTPSESSVIKRVAYEPLSLAHLRGALGIRAVKRVSLHEPLTGLLRVQVITLEKGTPRTEVWRALYGAAYFKADMGKITIAVNDDIDPDNADAIFWAMAYRMNPVEDVRTLPHRGQGHGPKREHGQEEDSTLLMDATMKGDMPPLALPKKEYMERAMKIWEELGLPKLRPQAPWFGYSLGDWLPQWDEAAKRAVEGRYIENGRVSEKQRKKGVKPETKFRPDRA